MALNLLYLIIGIITGWYFRTLLNLLKNLNKGLSGIITELSKIGAIDNLLKKAGIKDKLYIKKDTNLEDVGL